MKGSQLRLVVGSSLCLASVPTLAFASSHSSLVKRLSTEEPNSSGNGFTPTDFIPQHPSSKTLPQSQHLYQLRWRMKQAGLQSASTSNGMWIGGEAYLLTNLHVQRRPTAPKVRLRYVTVQSGDTLWGISRRYKVPLSSLEQWNHLSVDSILQTGQRIQMFSPPGGSSSRSVQQTPSPSLQTMSVKATVQTPSSLSRSKSSISSRSESTVANMAGGVFGMQIVRYAERFLGVPYRWAGGSPSTGFDCSGLVQFVFAHFGVSVARSSYAQFQTGSVVYRSNLLPGDLVFFDTDGPGASHVGIYVGNQQFISASGTAVSKSSLNQPYWADHYLGARRFRA